MQSTSQNIYIKNPRQGAALLVTLFIIFLVTVMVVHVWNTETIQLSVIRNSLDYERALYLANSGIHHAATELEASASWRGTVTDGSYPADDTYSATAVDGAPSQVIVTSTGVAGEVTRSIQAIIEY